MTTSQTLTSSITYEDGDFFSSMGDDDDDDEDYLYGSSTYGYDRGGHDDGARSRQNYHPKRDHYHDNKHHHHYQQQQLDKIRREQDVQMQICSIMTDPYLSIPSLVQKISRLVPGLLGLNEREKERSRLPTDVIVRKSGDPADPSDEGGCQNFSYYRAKIVVFDDDDYSHCSPDSSKKADYRVVDRSSFTSGGSSSPTSSVHHHDHLHRRSLPKLPMISDNTVDRLRHVFASEEIPFPNEELNFDTEHGAMSPPGPPGGLCCHSAKTGVVGKIEVFKYAMLGRPQVPRGRNSLHRSDGSENHLQQILEPTPEQASRLERLAEQLGKVIVHRRKQQDTQRRLQKLTDSNRRLVESQILARIGQWELDLTTNGSDSLYWSDAIYDIFRIPKTEFGASYESFLNAIHPDDRKYVDDSYTNSLKTKQPYDIVHRLLFKGENGDDDEVRWVREVCRTEYDGDTPLYSVGIVQDLESDQQLNDGISNIKSKFDGSGTTTATTTTMATTTATTSTPTMQTKTLGSDIPPAASEAEEERRTHDGVDQQVCQEVAACLKNILTSVYTLPENANHQKLKAIESCMDAMKLVKSMENSTRQESGSSDCVDVEKTNGTTYDNLRQQQHPRDNRHQQQQTSRTSTSTRRSLHEDFRLSLLITDDDDVDHHHDYRDEICDQSNYLQEQEQQNNNKQVSSRSSFFLSQHIIPLSANRSPERKGVIFSKCA